MKGNDLASEKVITGRNTAGESNREFAFDRTSNFELVLETDVEKDVDIP